MFIGKEVAIRGKGNIKGGKIESIIITVDDDGEPKLSIELEGGKQNTNYRYSLRHCEIQEEQKSKKIQEDSGSSPTNTALFRVLTEKIKGGDAELIVRKRNISAWKVRTGTATGLLTAILDESKQAVVGIR